MGKITDIVSQRKDPKRVSIFIDQEFAFGVSADIRFEKRLETGKIITEEQIIDLVESDQTDRLLNKALKFLSFRPRSEKEIRGYLLRKGKLKGVDKSDTERYQYEKSVDRVIGRLRKLDQIDDKEFAKWWVEQRKRFRPLGSRFIRMELMQKGVERNVIDEVTKGTEETDETKEEELARKAAAKKLNSYKKLDSKDFRIKLGQFLARRGFEWSVIKKVVDTFERNR